MNTTTTSPPRSPETAASTSDDLAQCILTARRYLQHKGEEPFDVLEDELVQVAARLKQHSKFTYARRILFKLRKTNPHLTDTLREEHALCTYKDKDLPVDRRLDRALRILARQDDDETSEIDVRTLMQCDSIETLGQLGSIYRRLWERDLDRRHLQLAYAFYRRGYERALVDPVNQRSMLAWTGVNAAFVLELIARDEFSDDAMSVLSVIETPRIGGEQSPSDLSDSQTGQRFRRRHTDREPEHIKSINHVSLRKGARLIRMQLIASLESHTETLWEEYEKKRAASFDRKTDVAASADEQQQNADLWWLMSTLGEAYFGVGCPGSTEWESAKKWFNRAAKVPGIQQWHLESTTRRIAELAQMQVAGAGLMPADEPFTANRPRVSDPIIPPARSESDQTGKFRRTSSAAERFTESDWGQVLAPFLGENRSEAVASAFRGKVGLALSGGGFRASLFHLGVLARLAELDVLRHVEVISCVSGGSVLGACYYLKLRRVLQHYDDASLTKLGPSLYINVVNELIDEFLAAVQKNLRTRLFTNPLSNLRMMLDPRYTRTERAADLFEKMFFREVDHLPGVKQTFGERLRAASSRSDWRMQSLSITPADTKRTEKTQTSGFHPRYDNWLRAHKVPMFIVNASTLNTGHNWQFTGNWMGEPPGRIATEVDANDRLRRLYFKEAPSPYEAISLGSAVAASACVPGLFEPITFSKLYEKQHVVRLVDGGVYDNQGVGALIEEDCDVVLISDASGQMTSETNPPDGMLSVPLRTNTILMERVRQAQFNELDARRRAGLLRQVMFVHLTKDLEMNQVDWLECPEPADPSFDRPEKQKPARTEYDINEDLQRALAGSRTDLDSFTEVEAYALMASGYQMANRYVPQEIGNFGDEKFSWRFLPVLPLLDAEHANPKLLLHLQTAKHRFFRLPRYLNSALRGWLKRTSVVVVAILVAMLAIRHLPNAVTSEFPQSVRISLPALLRSGLITVLVIGLLLASPGFRRWVPAFLSRAVLGTVGFAAAWAHILSFNWMYQKLGSMARFRTDQDDRQSD